MHIAPKAADHEVCRKYYAADNQTQAKHLKVTTVQAPEIKSYLELPSGELIEEEVHQELAATLKATSQVLAVARHLLAGSEEAE